MKEYTTAEFTDFSTPKQVVPQWQLCPKCQGIGLVHNVGWPYSDTSISTAPCTCDLCNGHKVISIYTGKPPML